MSSTNDDLTNREHADADESAWWQEIFRLGEIEEAAEPLSDSLAALFFSDIPSAEHGDSASFEIESGQTAGLEGGGGAGSRPGSRSRDRRTFTLETVDDLAAALRALPARDPAERRLDKQAVIRHLVEEITSLQQRGYTLEQVAALLSAEGVEVTTPTLKSYLQRAKKACGRGARKTPPRARLPL
jgi:hypothetical protein